MFYAPAHWSPPDRKQDFWKKSYNCYNHEKLCLFKVVAYLLAEQTWIFILLPRRLHAPLREPSAPQHHSASAHSVWTNPPNITSSSEQHSNWTIGSRVLRRHPFPSPQQLKHNGTQPVAIPFGSPTLSAVHSLLCDRRPWAAPRLVLQPLLRAHRPQFLARWASSQTTRWILAVRNDDPSKAALIFVPDSSSRSSHKSSIGQEAKTMVPYS